MDDGHPAGRSHLAGDEEFLLTPAPLRIFNAWSDEPWINEGAAVRVSLVCFGSAQHTRFGVEGSAAPSAKPGVSPVDSGTGHDGLVPSPGRVAIEQPLAIGGPDYNTATLNGQPVAVIHADLTAGVGLNLAEAIPLTENAKTAFQGITKGGAFDIPGLQARIWLPSPNPNNKPNAVVVRPWRNGMDVTQRPTDKWIVDFSEFEEKEASLFELPFNHVTEHVKPERALVARERRRRIWWQFNETAPGLRRAISKIFRVIATPEVSKHRVFVWLTSEIVPDKNLVVIARSDDTTFGILHSRFHELWSLRMGTSLEDRPRYTSSTTFETFPFPAGLTPADTVGATLLRQAQHESGRRTEPPPAGLAPGSPGGLGSHSTGVAGGEPLSQTAPILPHLAEPSRLPVAEAIATAAFDLNRLREAWLNPPDWVDWVITPEEEQAGFPRRPVVKPGHEADLKKRTLTNLYNARPAWLAMTHEKLDQAVAAAYGWDDYTPSMPDEEIQRRLLELNQKRAQMN